MRPLKSVSLATVKTETGVTLHSVERRGHDPKQSRLDRAAVGPMQANSYHTTNRNRKQQMV